MNRKMGAWRSRAVAVGLLLTFATAVSQASGQPATRDQFDGVWRIERPVFALLTAEGQKPPLKPEAEKLYLERQAARKKGDASFDPSTWCASLGYPRALLVDYPFELVVRPQHVVFLHEWNWWHNIVYFEGALSKEDVSVGPAGVDIDVPGAVKIRPEDIPGSMGYSVGAWEGDKLVVKTSDTVDTTLLDSAGMPHSDELKVTTTWRLVSADVLEGRFRFEDSATFTRPWEAVATFKRQAGPWEQEDVCLDRVKTGQPALKEVQQ